MSKQAEGAPEGVTITDAPAAPEKRGPGRPKGSGAKAGKSAVQSQAERTRNLQSIAEERADDTVHWGNGEEASGGPGPGLTESRPDDVEVIGDPPPAKPDPEDTTEPDKEPKETAAEKRARGLKALGAEQRARKLEQDLKAAGEREKAASDREAAWGKMSLSDILKARGANKDDLLEQLLTGSDGLDLPPKLEGDKADIAALKAELAKVTAKLEERDKQEQTRQVQQSVETIAKALEKADVDLVNSLPGQHERVLIEAYNAWKLAGEHGSTMDYVEDAAAVVEEELRKQHPKLAAKLDAAKGAEKGKPKGGTLDAAAASLSTPGIGRRTAARPNAVEAPLPDDPQERDAAIKKRYGWS